MVVEGQSVLSIECPHGELDMELHLGEEGVRRGVLTWCLTMGFSTRVPQTGWLVNNRNLFLWFIVRDQGSSVVGFWGDPSSGCRLQTSLCHLLWQEEGWWTLWGPFYKNTYPIYEVSTIMTPKVILFTLWVRISAEEFQRDTFSL